jgi:hypothetical protein
MKIERTKVIFRIWKSELGGVIALFPAIAATRNPYECQSYMHFGQHGAASVDLSRELRLATPAEYGPLATELRRLGYKLDIRKRMTRADLAARKEQLK